MTLCSAFGCNNRSDRKERKASVGHKEADKEVGGPSNSSGGEPSGDNGGSNGVASGACGHDLGSEVMVFEEKQNLYQRKLAHLKEKLTFHPFPKQSQGLYKKWVAAFNRDIKDLNNPEKVKICSEHFEPECYNDQYWIKFEMGLKLPRCRTLKEDAVPSIFIKGGKKNEKTSRPHTEARLEKKRRREEVENLLQEDETPSTPGEDQQHFILQHQDDPQPQKELRSQGVQAKLVVSMVSVGTWANLHEPEQPRTGKRDASTQTINDGPIIYHARGSPWKVASDHSYSRQVQTPISKKLFPMPTQPDYQDPSNSQSSVDREEEMDVSISSDEEVVSPPDPDWIPENDLSSESEPEDEDDAAVHPISNPVTDPKFIVFNKQLQELLNFCPKCGAPVSEKISTIKGSLLSVQLICTGAHKVTWTSQPVVNRFPLGNVLLSAACLFSGSTYTRLNQLAEFLHLKVPEPGTFFRHQKMFLFPTISGAWEKEKKRVREELSSRSSVTLIGDGRCDSPGYSAKYGTYTVMDSVTSKIVEFEVVQVTEVSSSVAMEKEGLKRVLEKVDEAEPKIHVETVATDRHIQIAKYMANEHPDKEHQFDVWHFSKNITSALNLKAKTKRHAILRPWIRSISNHLWWSAASCGGDPQQLRERWTSIVFHVCNIHEWDTGKVYHKCDHPPIEEDGRDKLWLKPGSLSHKLLQEVVFKKTLLEAIEKLTKFCHTGPLEVAHSLYLKYCPKRQHFSYRGMVARTMLAALDNNNNVGRAPATIKTGQDAGKPRYNIVFPKGRKRWVAKPVLEKKSYQHVQSMMESVHRLCAGTASPDEVADIQIPQLPSNISRQERPDKDEIIQHQKSRMQMASSLT